MLLLMWVLLSCLMLGVDDEEQRADRIGSLARCGWNSTPFEREEATTGGVQGVVCRVDV